MKPEKDSLGDGIEWTILAIMAFCVLMFVRYACQAN